MRKIKFIFLILIGVAFMQYQCGSNSNEKSSVPKVETCFLDKYRQINAKIYAFVDNDSMRFYHIGASGSSSDSLTYFGWFEFHVSIYKNSALAETDFVKWEKNMHKNTDLKDAFKSPQYRVRYSNFIYGIESGCFNEDRIDSLFHVFKLCLDPSLIQNNDIVRVKCGGEIE